MRTLRLITFCLLAVVALAPHALSDVSAEERKQAFEWFDSLGYPDVAKLPLGKVYIGEAPAENGIPAAPMYEYGFLRQSDSKRFSICRLNLLTASFTLIPPTEEHAGVSFEPVDLQTYARSRLTPNSPYGLQHIEFRYTAISHSGPIELFVLARACEGNGLSALATQLCNHSLTDMKSLDRDRPPLSFTEGIDDLISLDLLERMVRDYGNPKGTRTGMLSQLDAFLAHFPSSRYYKDAVDTQNELKRMVLEDREHAELPALPNTQVTLQNRISNLLFELRDQNGRDRGMQGECDVFEDPRREKSPASQLVKIGVPAAPALLDAMTDSRLTRCVESPSILRVGDVACAVLQRIALRSFESRSGRDWSQDWKSHATSVQVAAREWWHQVQTKGETQVLLEGIRRGDWYSIGQAQRLGAQHPEATLSALLEGLKHPESDQVRQWLTRIIGQLPIPVVIPILKTQLREGKDLTTRVDAAAALYAHGDTEGVRAMIQSLPLQRVQR